MTSLPPYAEVDLESQGTNTIRPATSGPRHAPPQRPNLRFAPFGNHYITTSRSSSQESVSRHSDSALLEKSASAPSSSQRSLWNPKSWSRKMKLTVAGVALVVCLVPAIAIPVSHALLKGHSQQVTQIAAIPATSSSTTNTVARQSAVLGTSTTAAVDYTSTVVPVVVVATDVATVTPSSSTFTTVTSTSASQTIVTTEQESSKPTPTTILSTSTVGSTTSSVAVPAQTVAIITKPVAKIAAGIPLRVMPLGASITWGWLSTDNDGYRKDLRNLITAGGDVLNFVGTRVNGDFTDKDVEGWPGLRVEQVATKANTAVPISVPNVILLNAGTNDCVQSFDLPNVGARMESLITSLYSMAPNTTIILSTLVLNKDPATETNVEATNAQYTALYNKLAAQGKKIVLADMHSSAGPSADQMADNTHPNDAGYAKMANVWYAALQDAGKKGFVSRAADVVPAIPADGGS